MNKRGFRRVLVGVLVLVVLVIIGVSITGNAIKLLPNYNKPVHVGYSYKVDNYNHVLKYAESPDGSSWNYEVVDLSPGMWLGARNSIAYDPYANKYSITYILNTPQGSESIKYATQVGSGGNCGYDNSGNFIGNWNCGMIEGYIDNSIFSPFSLGVGMDFIPDNTLQTIYKIIPGGELRYAEQVGSGGNCGLDNSGVFIGNWQCDTIDGGYPIDGEDVRDFSLAVNYDLEEPHIVYTKWENSDVLLKYTTRPWNLNGNCGPGNEWNCNIVDYQGKGGSIAIENGYNVVPQIAYNSNISSNLLYAKQVGSNGNCGYDNNGNFIGNWQCDVIDAGSSYLPSLGLDSHGNPHISYRSNSNQDLKYAKFVGSGGNCGPSNRWRCEIIDGSVNDGGYSYSSIEIIDGVPHITYSDSSNSNLKLAKYVGLFGGNCGPLNKWSCQPISNNFQGRNSDLK